MSDLPNVEKLKEYSPPLSSRIYSSDNEVLLEIGKEKRELAQLEEIPKVVVNAFLSAEDDNFYDHHGVDIAGVLRAAWANLKAGRVVQGGSTITQQVAKSLLLSSERSFKRKIKDFILAVKIEQKFSKEEILYLYLNQVYLGGGYYGIKASVRGYFGKELKDVSIAESALLAGLLVAPSKYSPYRNPLYAKKRQLYVLERMYITGKIEKEQYDKAIIEPIKLQKSNEAQFKAPYFTDWVRQRIIDLVGNEEFLTQGFEVKTTLDWKLQESAEKSISQGVREIDKRQGFKGAVEHIEETQIPETILSFRKRLLQKISTFTWFTDDGKLIDEFDFNEEKEKEYLEMLKNKLLEDDKLKNKFKITFVQGNEDHDNLLDMIDENEDYKAVVIGVNKYQRVIYVDVGGIRGVIPHDGFKWAHERYIKDEAKYFSDVDFPTQIVKTGDVVYVRFNSKKLSSLYSLVHKTYRERNLNPEFKNLIQKEKFYTFNLEQIPDVQAALASVDPVTGEILALVGGSDFSRSQFNRAIQAKRQPGSSFKPFIYAAALEQGYTPASTLLDTPQALSGVDTMLDWKPKNYDGKFKGLLTLRQCLEESRNVPTIMLLQQIGVEKVSSILERHGISLNRELDLSIALGSFGINLIDMVSMYSMFPNGGKKIHFKSINSIKNSFGEEFFIDEKEHDGQSPEGIMENEEATVVSNDSNKKEDELPSTTTSTQPQNGEVVQKIDFVSKLTDENVYDKRLAFIMTQLLRGVVQNGTGRKAASLSPFIGGKTGTTNSYIDAWFVGFSRNTVTGVWTGFDDNTTLGFGETGARSALPIWIDFMQQALKIKGENDFTPPPGVISVLINAESGKTASSSTANTIREYFVEGTQPGGEFDTNRQMDEMGILDDDDYYSQQ